MPSSDPAPSAVASSALPTSPSSTADAGASSDALEVANVPESLYVASSPKPEAASSVSRFAPFEESYDDMNELRRALKVLSVQRNAPYYMQHSSPQRVEARCPSWRQRKRPNNHLGAAATAAPICDFVVSANRHANGRVYVTRAIFNHSQTCSVLHARLAANAEAATADTNAGENGRASTVTASALLETALPFMGQLAHSRGGRDAVKPKDVSDIMKEKFGVKPSYMTAWRALSAFRKQRKEEDSSSYMKLDGYLKAFAETNAGSLVAFEHQDNTQVPPSTSSKPNAKVFGRAFLCPKPLHDALRYCRGSMLLSVFLVTSAFGGVVFTATAQDAMGDNVPMAIGLAPAETENDWRFFLLQLRRAFPDLERSVTSLVHNRGEELARAVHAIFPNCPQSNEVEIFIRSPTSAVSDTTGASTTGTSGPRLPLDASMQWVEALCAKSPLMILVGWVSQVARTLFQRYERYGHLSAEYPAEFHSLAAEYEGEASRYDVVRTSESEFEVVDQQTSAGRIVNFAKQTCTCGEYDVSRFPCLHVFLAVTHAGMLRTDVIPRIFLMTSLKTLYAGRITPIDIATVPSDEVTVPQPRPKARGRPCKVQQIQQFGDPKQEKLSCSLCGVKGHNKRTCKRVTGGSAAARDEHTDDVAAGQDDTTFLVSTYGDAIAFDNSAIEGADSESHASDGQSLPLSSGKRRRLARNDSAEEKKSDEGEEQETTGIVLV
ncbi:SWIM zinc finger domain-containing protein [Phytophthora infestans]|uniref:SWIM zinc finger domain-containing protein n=1 Tax=Phytophthora infestans TaxID=4787 RepID=A0A833T4A1_PHYIN|nr:SWIM zinc finger domain-containing protein [Phytophthora infestans]